MTNRPEIEVVKIGGSLLSRNDFVPALQQTWLRLQTAEPGRHFVLLVGGGELVDVLRKLDEKFILSPGVAHQLAIELMQVAGTVVATCLSGLHSTGDWGELKRRLAAPGATLFLAGEFLRSHEPQLRGTKLPVDWQATSDSIAARLCLCLGATQLRLVKSRAATGEELANLSVAAHSGLVDSCLPALAETLEVEFDTLDPPPENPS